MYIELIQINLVSISVVSKHKHEIWTETHMIEQWSNGHRYRSRHGELSLESVKRFISMQECGALKVLPWVLPMKTLHISKLVIVSIN